MGTKALKTLKNKHITTHNTAKAGRSAAEGWKERDGRLEGARRKAGRSVMEGMEGWREDY